MKICCGIWLLSLCFAGCVQQHYGEKDPPMERNESRPGAILDGVASLRIGDTYSKTVLTLGPPTYDNVLTRKETPEVIGRRVIYVIRQADNRLLNEKHDAYVSLYFDKYDKLTAIAPVNVEREK